MSSPLAPADQHPTPLAPPTGADEPARRAATWRVLLRAVRLVVRAAPGQCLIVVLAALGTAVVPIAIAWCMRAVFDAVARSGPALAGTILGPVALGCLLGLLDAATSARQRLASDRIVRAVRLRSQQDLFTAVDSLPWLSDLEKPRFQNQLKLAEAAADQTSRQLLASGIAVIRSTLQGVGWLGSVVVVWPWMAPLLALATVPFFLIAHRLAQRQAALYERLVPSGRRRMFFQNLLIDPRAAKEARLFNTGGFLRERIRGILREESRQEDLVQRDVARSAVLLAAISGICTAVATFAVAGSASARGLTVGDLSLFIAAAAGAQVALGTVSTGVGEVVAALRMIRHYFSFLEQDAYAVPRPDPLTHLPAGQIEFRDVWFRYDSDGPWVLKGVSFVISRGAKVGLVGQNGAGKSTLVKLLCQLYEPTRGDILFDGHSARTLAPEVVRSRITAVFQDFMNYDLTVAENLAIGNLARLGDVAELRRAAELVELHHDIDTMPHGYDTMLSKIFIPDSDETSSVTLMSGGQWQRLAIARALLREDATIAILDEPTSGLDTLAQHRLRQVIHSIGVDRTVVLISHHLGSIRGMDVIFVLDHGALVETGTHDELMTAAGGYHELFSVQAKGFLG